MPALLTKTSSTPSFSSPVLNKRSTIVDSGTVLPTLSLVLGETSSIAREKAAHIESLVDPDLVLAANSWSVAADLSVIDDEGALVAQSGNQGVQGHRDRMMQVAKAKFTKTQVSHPASRAA